MNSIEDEVAFIDSRGSGRPTLVVTERGFYESDARALFDGLTVNCKVVMALTSAVTNSNWRSIAERLLKECETQGLKQVTAIGFGGAASLMQHIALVDPKRVRRLVLVDPSTRPHPSRLTRWADTLERLTPLGLPLRLRTEGFDSKPLLHRIRCPVLVVISRRCDAFRETQAVTLSQSVPTAWLLRLSEEGSELVNAVNDFHEVAAKCPQKSGVTRDVQSAVP